jgi:hypothetical protein
MTKPGYLMIYCLLLLSTTTLKAQNKEMFIQQVSGRTIIRENFKSGGKLTGKQIFDAENMVQSGGSFFVNINTKIYDEAQKLESAYTTSYRCNPEESNVLLSVFTINPKKQKISVSVKSGDFKKLYDLNYLLRSLSLTMYIESGILNFLGSKNNIDMTNRSITKENSGWKITENLTIKASLLGVRIKTINYSATEYLSGAGLLEKQIFKQSNGDYFTINYK